MGQYTGVQKHSAANTEPGGPERGGPEPGGDQPGGDEPSVDELRLELRRIQKQALAARLEARAAELELLLRRVDRGEPGVSGQSPPAPHASTLRRPPASPAFPLAAAPNNAPGGPPAATAELASATAVIASWASLVPVATAAVAAPHHSTSDAAPPETVTPDSPITASPLPIAPEPPAPKKATAAPRATTRPSAVAAAAPSLHHSPRTKTAPEPRRRRMAGWWYSAGAHLAIVLLLASMTFSIADPADQVALTMAADETEQAAALETVRLDVETPPPTSVTESPAEAPAPLAPIDPLAGLTDPPVTSLPVSALESPPSLDGPLADSIDASAALASADETTSQFCGVASGGNHFVYIVDSSQSMKNGRFESARLELLQSIDALQPQQRFYIIFYGEHLDRMCVSAPDQPDDYSVLASDENKRRARRWAMSVKLQPGASPDEALLFALKQRPDVIFLLSDGEFPQRIEDLLAEHNQTSNLFGHSGPISIVHTIGYHSRAGEARMRRLAAANGGQYRYIPPGGR